MAGDQQGRGRSVVAPSRWSTAARKRRAPSDPVPGDREIIAGLEAAESWAAATLYDRLEPVVERTLYRVLQHRASDFEDLFQTTFERIVRTLVSRRFASQCSLTTWAAAIATNVAIDSLRARIRERRVFAAQTVASAHRGLPTAPDAAGRLEARSEVERLQRVLAAMNPAQADAVFLHDLLGHSLAEIADIVGITVAAAQSRLVRGRKEFLRQTRQGETGGRSS
jgi:RNA polymerase sigma-70 factor (ECF subfamily)